MARKSSKTIVGERSEKLKVVKREAGLPSWKELSDDLDKGLVSSVERRIELMKSYAASQKALLEVVNAAGFDVVNVVNELVDLNARLMEKEEQFYKEKELVRERVKELEVKLEDPQLDSKERERVRKELFELRERLFKTVLDDPAWVRAKELTNKHLQFLAKQGLDMARFQHEVLKQKKSFDDDSWFSKSR